MADARDISETLAERASDPKHFEADGQKVSERPLPEMVEADRYLTKKKVVQSGGLPFRAFRGRSRGV